MGVGACVVSIFNILVGEVWGSESSFIDLSLVVGVCIGGVNRDEGDDHPTALAMDLASVDGVKLVACCNASGAAHEYG